MVFVLVLALALVPALFPASPGAAAEGLSFLRESPEQTGVINPGDFKQLTDALQGKVKLVDIVNFGRLRFLSWPARRRLTYGSLERFTDFAPLRPPEKLAGYQAPVMERVAPLKVQFALKVKSLNKLLASLGSPAFLPAELEGKAFTLSTSPELRVRYPSTDLKRRSDLLLSQTRDPVLEVPAGIDLDEVRTALLALPLWPEPMRRQMSWIPAPGGQSAFALNPVEGTEAERTTVNGQPGVFLSFGESRMSHLPPQWREAHRQMRREAEESGDPWMERQMRGNTLLWHQNGLLVSLSAEDLTLAEAKAIAEMMR